MSSVECEYQEICPTTNFWVNEKKDFIKAVCKNVDCMYCIARQDFIRQKIGKGDEEWKRLVKFFKERRKQFPPHGVMPIR